MNRSNNIKVKAKRNAFTPKEDEKLKMLVENCGKKLNWRTISFDMEGRTPRQCRERYVNYLDPKIQHTNFSPEEDQIILNQYSLLGNKWQAISEYLPGRTANSIRNRYFYLHRKQLNYLENPSPKVKEEEKFEQPLLLNLFAPEPEIPIDSIFFQGTEAF